MDDSLNIFGGRYVRPAQGGGEYGPLVQGGCGCSRGVYIAILVVVIIAIIGCYAALFRGLPKLLAARGWVLYTRDKCDFCVKQLQLIDGFSRVVVTDENGKLIGGYTSTPPIPVNDPRITGFPFWYNTITRESRVGFQNVSALWRMVLY